MASQYIQAIDRCSIEEILKNLISGFGNLHFTSPTMPFLAFYTSFLSFFLKINYLFYKSDPIRPGKI